jgi:very-short-patch-repair endonuclease
VADIAAAQHGVFARSQVAGFGGTKDLIRNRCAAGRWAEVAPHVFCLAGAPPTWRQALMAASLAWGVGAVVSHRAAAALWRLAGFESRAVEITVPRGRDRRGPGTVHRNALHPVDVTMLDRIPVTTPARTLIDIASTSPPEVVEEALDDALRRGLVTIPRLRWRLDGLGRGRPGVGVMRKLIDTREPAVPILDSTFERRLLRRLREAGLPEPVLQYEIRRHGRVVARVDFAYPEARLAIEADGYRWHSGRARWNHDRRRANELTLLGWRIIHVTWDDFAERSDQVVAAVRRALAVSPGG